MLRGHRYIIIAILTTVLSSCAAKSPPSEPVGAPDTRPAGTGRVQVTVTGFESEEGQVLVALFLNASGWPDDETRAFGALVLPIRDGQAIADFDDVPAGPFAVSVFHDRDEDRELDAGVFGIPTEDYGFSRDARDLFGPPSFEEARLEVAAMESMSISIKVD